MRTISLFHIARIILPRFSIAFGVWLELAALGHAQMSTFPNPPPLAPPPLAPPTDHAADNGAKTSSSANPTPDATDLTADKKNSDSAPATPPSTAATLSSMTALDDKVSLEAGDTVSFRVIEDRDQAVTRIVTDTGEVDFPYIGRVKVAGKTCHEVAVEVKKLLEVDYYKHATVIVGLDLIIGQDKTKAKDMAWVVGEVRSVGPQELSKVQPVTVSQVIMRAGGFGDFADQGKVKLVHRSAQAANAPPDAQARLSESKDFQVVDVKSVFEGKSAADPVVHAGDYIIVPKQWVHF